MSQEGYLPRHNQCRFAFNDLHCFFFSICQFFLTLLHPGEFAFGAYISLIGLLFLLSAQLGQVGSLVDKTAFDELFAHRHVVEECLTMLPHDVFNYLFSREYHRQCRSLIGACSEVDQRWREICPSTQQEEVFWRAHLDRAILPLLEANQTRLQHFASFERSQRWISQTYHHDLDKVEEVGHMFGRINEDRTTLCIFRKAITDGGAEAIKHWLSRMEKDDLFLTVGMIQRTGLT